MDFKPRRIRSELDRLLSDEGTRNLLSGIKMLNKNKLTRIVTRNKRNGLRLSKEKSKRIIKKSLSLLHHHHTSSSVNKIRKGHLSKEKGVKGSGRSSSTCSSSTSSSSASSSGPAAAATSLYATRIIPANALPLLATSIRDHVAFVTLSYQTHVCTVNTQDLKLLQKKLEEFESQKKISVIVLNSSSDKYFCDGLDYKELIQSDLTKRKQVVQQRIQAVKDLMLWLTKSKKLLVASVNGGIVNGFGLTLLSLFDLVYANDKATFSLQNYLKLKQPPEGISAFNPGQLHSPIMKSLVFMGRAYTSSELSENGFLLSEILWDGSRYYEQLASRLLNGNFHQNTKSIYKSYSSKNTKQLGSDLTQEFNLLESVWISDSWQANFQKHSLLILQ